MTHTNITEKFNSYPERIQPELERLRQLILKTAAALHIDDLKETLKWGQPSYLSQNGSTLRIDWKGKSNPDQFAMYFHCQTKLIDTIKEIYPKDFQYEGNRAIIFQVGDDIQAEKLKVCIELSLIYHTIKHLPLLGL